MIFDEWELPCEVRIVREFETLDGHGRPAKLRRMAAESGRSQGAMLDELVARADS